MLSFKQFVNAVDDVATDDVDSLVRTTIFGLEMVAVRLPAEMLTEDRVSRMNDLWDLLDEREALVVAMTRREED